ncbi:alpha-D-ribose 1-methylphosphonate 5-triphosphate diphosphatase [Nocardia sp. NPDC004711]
MTERRAINHARVVTSDKVLDDASILIEDGRIVGISSKPHQADITLDAGGRYVLPGLVDLHSDGIERQLVPRPRAEFPPTLAFSEMDRYFTAAGITTGFHSLVYMDGGARSIAQAQSLFDLITQLRPSARVRHEIHLRCEIAQPAAVDAIEDTILSHGQAQLVSVMDHSPGQGKYRNLDWFASTYLKEHPDAAPADIEAAFHRSATTPATIHDSAIERVVAAARARGLLVCSHDDDSPERVDAFVRHGIGLAEFPIDLATARRVKELGLPVCMGAPNVVRGRSYGGSVSARDAVGAGLVDILCSDYHPPSLLAAAFTLASERILTLPAAVALVSRTPAHTVWADDRGTITEGAPADLIVVGLRFGLPAVTHTLVGGRLVAAADADDASDVITWNRYNDAPPTDTAAAAPVAPQPPTRREHAPSSAAHMSLAADWQHRPLR